MTPYTMEDAEAEMRAALDSGDRERIDAAASLVDRLEVLPVAPTLHSAALWYVSIGLPTFPLIPGRKGPTKKCDECSSAKPECMDPKLCGHDLCHGFKDASIDPADINRWWTDGPQANIGIATGHGFDAVDIDGLEGQTYRAQHWDDLFGNIDADCIAKVLTPRPGGMHIYVPVTGDRNDTSIVPGVDYRGLGGYVVAPPSVIAPGSKDHPGAYRFLGVPNFPAMKAAA